MSLEQWRQNGWLQRSDATVPEIQQLLAIVDREIADAAIEALSTEGRFEHAYHAALQLCAIPLRSSGYRVPKGGLLHKRTIESLRHTLGEPHAETADYLDRCSRQRGRTVYEQVGVVTLRDAEDLLSVTRQLRTTVVEWLRAVHPELLPSAL
ncbi:MAG: hypothetical protein FJ276_05530 [Planctomycetes bacterium]|nr:hypothetical protein [Planctomycetota bacterium]